MSREWNAGAPQCPGWYEASFEHNPDVRRYWHGPERGWSAPVYADSPAGHFERAKNTIPETTGGIVWREVNQQHAEVEATRVPAAALQAASVATFFIDSGLAGLVA